MQVQAGEGEHVDQPAGAAGDAVGAKDCVEFLAAVQGGVGEEVLTDLEQQSQRVVVFGIAGGHVILADGRCQATFSMAARRFLRR
jgi:hypothetical protein